MRLWPDHLSFDNFVAVTTTRSADGTWLFGRQLFNSLVVSFATSLVGVTLATTAGYALSRWSFWGRDRLMATFLLTQMFPATMTMLPLYVLLRALHLLDQFAGLALAYTATALPFCVMTMRGYYRTIPVELEQAALLDGCSPWQAFTKVTLPLAAPALAITALFSFMAAWSEFMVARIVVSRHWNCI